MHTFRFLFFFNSNTVNILSFFGVLGFEIFMMVSNFRWKCERKLQDSIYVQFFFTNNVFHFRLCMTDLASDVNVKVGEMSFHLHKVHICLFKFHNFSPLNFFW